MIGDLRLCDICIAQYGTPPTYEAGDCRIHRTDYDGFTILNAEGSRTFEDWVTNLMAGWTADASAILPLLPAFGLPLILVGHSKGGTDAEDLAELLLERGANVVSLTTFEAAAGGKDRSGGKMQKLPGTPWVHHGDIVPSLPFGRSHPRPLVWFNAPALSVFPDAWANHHLLTAVRPGLIASGVTA